MRRVLATTDRADRVVLAVLTAGYVVLAVVLWQGKDFSKQGPLALRSPEASEEELAGLSTDRSKVERYCFTGQTRYGDVVRIVTTEIGDQRLFACYDLTSSGGVDGVHVVDADGFRVRDPALLKPAGVWPYYAVVKSADELVLGGVGLVVLMSFGFFVATRRRAGPPGPDLPWWGNGAVMGVLAAVPVLGWGVIMALPRVPRARRGRFVMWGVVGWGLVFGFTLVADAIDKRDPWGMAVVSYMAAAVLASVALGVRARPRLALTGGGDADPERAGRWPAGVPVAPSPAGGPSVPGTGTASAPTGTPSDSAAVAGPGADLVRIRRPDDLPTFADVGGMVALKQEMKETIGLVLAFSEHADAYRITWNGILLHGRPGTGKTFMAQATAGEFGLNLLHVAVGDLVSSFRGESARNVDKVFRLALRNIPALLFFDEFDSIATRRDDNPDQESRRTVNQLLQSLESSRKTRELIVVAATNDIGSLDPAVIRPGRFDRHVHIPFPDREARTSILQRQLEGRPGAAAVDVGEVARRTDGLTPATLAQLVSSASMQAMRESASSADGRLVPLTTDRLLAAIRARGGQDRPTVEDWTWDRLILPPKVKAELQEVAALTADPDRAARYGVDPPSGVLLYGPPGTGKSTVARVLAAQGGCSFYPVSAADLTSKWLGESERLIAQLFERAGQNRPSIVFIDEIDAIAGARGGFGTYDRQVNQLLQEMDGVESTAGVVVIGATNRKDTLDPALLRGGRLSRHIEIPLPDEGARRAMLGLFTAAMPARGVDLDELARRSAGLSGADLEALCQEAAMQAIIRGGPGGESEVTSADFAVALAARTGRPQPPESTARRRRSEGDEGYI